MSYTNYFTDKEFEQIYNDIVIRKPSRYDKMAEVVERMIFPNVVKWCSADLDLRGKQYERDVMQEVHIRLLTKCVTGFFLRNGKPNYDPDGFKNWVFTVATNIKNDYAKKVRRYRYHEPKGLEDIDEPSTEDGLTVSEEMLGRLNGAFRVVLASDSKVYKVLTWLAQMIIIVKMDVTKIESNGMLINQFEYATLDRMLQSVEVAATSIPWLTLDADELAALRKRLDKTDKDGVRLGDKRYSDFFMQKGAKASISDWVNRMNGYVLKTMVDEEKEKEAEREKCADKAPSRNA